MPILLVVLQFTCIGLLVGCGAWALPWWSWVLFALGLAVFGWAAASLGGHNFTVMPDPRAANTVSVRGIYRFIRHPMYTAVLLCGSAVAFGAPNVMRWTALAVCAVVLLVKIRYEERAITRKHADYPDRMKGVARLVPGLW